MTTAKCNALFPIPPTLLNVPLSVPDVGGEGMEHGRHAVDEPSHFLADVRIDAVNVGGGGLDAGRELHTQKRTHSD